MARRDVEAGVWRYTIADDDPLAPDLAHWAILRARVIDELTREAPRAPLRLVSNLRAATARTAEGGYCGLVARPRDVPQALLHPGMLEARVEAEGFLPLDLTPAIDAARRALNTNALEGDLQLDVLPADTTPASQFRPGRGVQLGPPTGLGVREFHTIPQVVPPASSTIVPLDGGVETFRAIGAPVAGVPIVLPTQSLHRAQPVRLRGLARRRTGPTTAAPATGASIGISGIWLAYPDTQTLPPDPADFCAIEPGLRFAHSFGGTVSACTLTASGIVRALVAPAPPGSRSIAVTPGTGLTPLGGDVLQVGDPISGEADIVVTAPFIAPVDPSMPLILPLTAPIAYLHRAGDAVQEVAVAAVPPAVNVSREAQPGDRVLFAPGITGFATTAAIVVEAGTAREAYYRATQYPSFDGAVFDHQILPDSNGRFEWPPLARVARVRIEARRPPHPPQTIDFALDHGGGDNTLAIVFS